jgi:peptide chain release factor 1
MSDHAHPLAALSDEFRELEARLADPELANDLDQLRAVAQRYHELEPIVAVQQAMSARQGDLSVARELLDHATEDERPHLEDEVDDALADIERLEGDLRQLLVPRDPHAGRAVIIEIRGAEGGEEANLFARDLFDMYAAYAANRGWKVETLSHDPSDLGGVNQVTFVVRGDDAWQHLKFEGGPHRVQRVPVTESQGRVHTSSATVAVLAEADEVDVTIDERDLSIDVYRSSGAGGQHVNTTDSAVRITHLATGIAVACQQERSQHKNRATAWNMLRARLYELELKKREEKANAEAASKTDIGWGHQIRSYVLQPYQLVKDLRTGVESTSPSDVLDGDLDDFMEASLSQRIDGAASPQVADLD